MREVRSTFHTMGIISLPRPRNWLTATSMRRQWWLGLKTLSITTATTLHIVNGCTELLFRKFKNSVFLVEMPAEVNAQIANSLLHVLDFGLNLRWQMEPCQSTSLILLQVVVSKQSSQSLLVTVRVHLADKVWINEWMKQVIVWSSHKWTGTRSGTSVSWTWSNWTKSLRHAIAWNNNNNNNNN